MTRIRTIVIAVLLAGSAYGMVRGAMPAVQSGTWAAAAPMASIRAGAASALLPSCAILVTGGSSTTGALASAELFGADGTFSPVSPMSVARTDHAAVLLNDGRVFVVGGRGADGAVGSAETYLAGSWMPAGTLADGRWGHTATLMKDGRVLIAGGQNALGNVASVEVFDPTTGSLSVVGTLATPRRGHAAVSLVDGRVLIAAGFDGTHALSTIEVFDSASGSLTGLPVALASARAGLSATRLLDGRVLFFGGNSGNTDLASGEIFDSTAGTMSATPSAGVARRDHHAFLLPNNNAVLIIGGVTALGPSASSELYLPWLDQFWATGSMTGTRAGATASAMSFQNFGPPPASSGVLMVAGGQGSASSEVYGYATVKTDRDDYGPGLAVTISGSGWQAGETVTLVIREVNTGHPDRTLTALVDQAGRFTNSDLTLDIEHLGVRFYVIARGVSSQAQVTFTDGNVQIAGTVKSSAATNPPITNATVTATCSGGCGETATTNTTGSYSFLGTNRINFPGNSATISLTASATGFTSKTVSLEVSNQSPVLVQNFLLDPANAAPIANNDTYATNEDTSLTVAAPGVFANDTDANNNPLTAILVSGPTNAAPSGFTLNANGSFSYTPAPNFSGTDSFTYKANDGTADSNTATVTITIHSVNDAPFAANDTYTTNEDTPLTVASPGVLGNDTDTEGSTLSAILVNGPAHAASFTLNANGSFNYTPASNFSGTDTFTYKANDGAADSNQATVTITVNAVNDAPVAVDDIYSTNEDTPLTVSMPGVLGNDTDAEGNTLSVVLVAGPTHAASFTLNANGSFSYTPQANFFGTDVFTYKANDGTADSNTAKVAITVNAVNDPPVAVADSATTNEDVFVDINVLGNDTDVDNTNAQLSVAGITDVQGGTAVLQPDGRTVRFTPAPDANSTTTPGGFSFNYTAKDPDNAVSNAVMVSITVNAVNDPPVAVGDTATTDEDVFVDINVLANDTDVDNLNSQLSVGGVSYVQGGTATVRADGRTVRFTPAPNANSTNTPGGFSFKYTAKDPDNAQSNPATVTITVNAVNDPPVAVADAATTDEDTPVDINVIANDTDVDNTNAQLSVVAVTDAQGGTAALQADGRTVRFTPAPNANSTNTPGGFSFKYTAKDPDNAVSNAVTVTITVNAVNDAPVLGAVGNKSGAEGSLLSFGVTATDVDGDVLTFSLVGAPMGATITSGTFNWTPPDNGTFTFTIKVTDNGTPSLYDSEQITVTVSNVAPTATFNFPVVPIGEGATFGISLTYPVDPSSFDTAAGFKYAFDCGSGIFSTLSSTSGVTCTAVDNPGAAVRGKIVDKDGGYTTYTAAITINNLAPAVTILTVPSGAIYAKGTSVPFSARVIDPGSSDSYTYLWTFESAEDSFSVTGSGLAGAMTINSPCSFPIAGVYNVTLTVTDKDGAATTTTFVNNDPTAPAYVVVYDPSAGFVTGGGWVTSPAGASVEFPTAVGKASFGFVSKYQKGKTTTLELTGQTQFQFQAGGINFHSTSYEWLVVAGARAQFKGDGTINGSGDYGFILTAIDGAVNGGGGIDRFRIKIWDKATDVIVYDNQINTLDNDGLTTPGTIVQGSIVIHDPGKK